MVDAALRSWWVLSGAELRALGLTDDQIRQRVRTGVLHGRHIGVFAVGRPDLSFEGRCRAALLACECGAISHGSAAALWDLRKPSGPIHVTVPRPRRKQAGLVIHRPRSFGNDDVTECGGLRVTTVARTLLDLAAFESPRSVGWLIHEAQVRRVFDAVEVYEACCRHPHHRGRRKLLASLHAEVAPTRSGLERAFLDLISGRLPAPVVNGHVWTGDRHEEVDFHWPSARLIVETDGGRYHSSRWRQRVDADKTARLDFAGWTVRRYSDLAVTLAPTSILAEVVHLHAVGCKTGT